MLKVTIASLCIFFTICNADIDNLSNGVEKKYYSSGALKTVKEYYDDKKNKRIIEFFENGDTASIANYFNGHYVGDVIFYHSTGKKNFQETYDSSGLSNGTFYLWSAEGKLKQTGKKKLGKKSGEWKSYFDNGLIETIETYENGKKNGWSFYFDLSGDTIKKIFYVDGKIKN